MFANEQYKFKPKDHISRRIEWYNGVPRQILEDNRVNFRFPNIYKGDRKVDNSISEHRNENNSVGNPLGGCYFR